MHNRPVRFGAAIRINRIGCERFARFSAIAATFVACALVIASGATAQNMMMPAAEPMMDSGAPMTLTDYCLYANWVPTGVSSPSTTDPSSTTETVSRLIEPGVAWVVVVVLSTELSLVEDDLS